MEIDFSLKVEYIPRWNDNRELPEKEQCKALISTMESFDLIDMAEVLDRAGLSNSGEVDTDDLNVSQARVLMQAVSDYVPKYLELINLNGKDGPIDIHTVVKFPKFQALCLELLMRLATDSQPDEEDLGN